MLFMIESQPNSVPYTMKTAKKIVKWIRKNIEYQINENFLSPNTNKHQLLQCCCCSSFIVHRMGMKKLLCVVNYRIEQNRADVSLNSLIYLVYMWVIAHFQILFLSLSFRISPQSSFHFYYIDRMLKRIPNKRIQWNWIETCTHKKISNAIATNAFTVIDITY